MEVEECEEDSQNDLGQTGSFLSGTPLVKSQRVFRLRIITAIAAFIILSSGLSTGEVKAATFKPIQLNVIDSIDYQGTQTFQFQAVAFNVPPDRSEALISPHGVVFSGNQIHLPTASSFAAIRDQIVGEWTFTTMLLNQPQSLETYHFSVADFDPEAYGVVRPTILSPANGATVEGPVVVFNWTPATIPNTLSISGVLSHTQSLAGSLTWIFDAPPFPNAYAEFTVNGGQSLPGVITEGPPPSASPLYDLYLDFAYGKDSQIRVLVAPEPVTTIVAMAALAFGVHAHRGMRRRQGR